MHNKPSIIIHKASADRPVSPLLLLTLTTCCEGEGETSLFIVSLTAKLSKWISSLLVPEWSTISVYEKRVSPRHWHGHRHQIQFKSSECHHHSLLSWRPAMIPATCFLFLSQSDQNNTSHYCHPSSYTSALIAYPRKHMCIIYLT